MENKNSIQVYCLVTMITTSAIIYLQSIQLVPEVIGKLSMCVPAAVAVLIQKFCSREKSLRDLMIKLRPQVLWLAPIFVSLFFVLLSAILSFAFDSNYFRPFSKIAGDQTLAKFSSNPLTGLFLVFLVNIFIAPLLNLPLFLGEEVGWRSFLGLRFLTKRGLLMSGILWGIWHWPMIWFFGLNYSFHRTSGLLLFIPFCVFFHVIWCYWLMRCRSIIPVALAHGVLNWTGISLSFFVLNDEPKFELLYGPTGLVGLTILAVIASIHYKKLMPYLNKN